MGNLFVAGLFEIGINTESILYKQNFITFRKEIVKDNFCQVHFIPN